MTTPQFDPPKLRHSLVTVILALFCIICFGVGFIEVAKTIVNYLLKLYNSF